MLRALVQEAKAKKLELLEQARKYQDAHQLERFQPHEKQQLFFDALRDSTIKSYVLLAGNRFGKTTAAVAAAASLAQGRYPWVPIPPKCLLPASISTTVHADESLTVVYPDDVWQAIQATLTPAAISSGPTPDKQVCKDFLEGWKNVDLGTPKHPIPAVSRRFDTPKLFKQFVALCAAPPDPGKLRWNPPIKIRVLAEDMTALEQVQLPKFRFYVAPEWVVAKKKNSFGIETHWVFEKGSVVDFLTYQQDPSMMEGWDGHVTLYDEPPPRPVYIANLRGLVDHGGISIFSMTPLKEPWIADEIVNKPDPAIWSLAAATRDNPHLKAADIDAFESALSPDEKETRMHGKFLHLQGLVFKDFKAATHVVPCREPPKDSTVYCAIDPHARTPHALVFMWVDRKGNMFVCRDIFRNGTPEEIAEWVVDFHDNVHKIEQVIIDPFSQGDKNRGETTYEIVERLLADEGIPIEFGSKDLSSGILQVQDCLKSRNGIASLFIDPSCERTIWEVQRIVWADWRNGGGSDKEQKNVPVAKDNHMWENIRRLIQLPAEYRSPRQASDFAKANQWRPLDDLSGY